MVCGFIHPFQHVKCKEVDFTLFAGFCTQAADGTGSEISGVAVRFAVTAHKGILQAYKVIFMDKALPGNDQTLPVRNVQRNIAESRDVVGNDFSFLPVASGGAFDKSAVFIHKLYGETVQLQHQ